MNHIHVLLYFLFQDAEGKAPIHVAISNQHSVIIQLLISHPDIRLNIRDRQGMTPFACAMTHKNNKAAEAILKREPGAAEQVALTLSSFPFMKGQLWCYTLMISNFCLCPGRQQRA